MSDGPPPAAVSLPPEVRPLLAEADQILGEAARRGLALRLVGSAGVLAHCPRCTAASTALRRDLPRDLDFYAYAKQQRDLGRMFGDLGYRADPSVAFSQEYGIDRLIYLGHAAATKVDVFLDVLRMSHTIEFKGRLAGAGPAAPAADLLLTKLQIHEITEKDVKDIGALLTAHPPGEPAPGGGDRLDTDRVLGLTGRDWGLWYTASSNLALAEQMLAGWDFAGEAAASGAARAGELRRRIEQAPKSVRWKARARVGTRMRWYEDVGDADQQGQGDAGLGEGWAGEKGQGRRERE